MTVTESGEAGRLVPQRRRGRKMRPMAGSASSEGSGSNSARRETLEEGKTAGVLQTSHAEAAVGLEKVQARHDHRETSEIVDEQDNTEGEEATGKGERQTWQEEVRVGGFKKVQRLQAQDEEEDDEAAIVRRRRRSIWKK